MNTQSFADNLLLWMAISSVIILVSGVITFLFFRNSAAWRHQIWLNVLWALLLLPILTFTIKQTNLQWKPTWTTVSPSNDELKIPAESVDAPELSPSLTAYSKETPDQPDLSQVAGPSVNDKRQSIDSIQPFKLFQKWNQSGKTMLVWIWCIGTAFLLSRWIIGWWRLQNITKFSATISSKPIADIIHQFIDDLNIKGTPRIRSSDHITTPMLVGTLSPMIVLPSAHLASMTPSELKQILMHECAHLHRHDHWVLLLQRIGRILFWLNPLFHWMQHELNRSREELCDNHVLQVCKGVDYAQTLSKVSTLWKAPDLLPDGLAIGFRKHQLVQRVEALLDDSTDHRMTLKPYFRSITTSIFLGFTLGSVMVAAGFSQDARSENFTNKTDPITHDSDNGKQELRPYPNEIKPQKYLMSNGRDVHEIEYYPWVEESDYQRVPESLLRKNLIPTFAWPTSSIPRIRVSGSFTRFFGLTHNQVIELNQAVAQALHDYDMLKVKNLKFTYHSKRKNEHNGVNLIESVGFEWYPKKIGLIDTFKELRKNLEIQIETIIGPKRATYFWAKDDRFNLFSAVSDGALSKHPEKKPYPNSFIFGLQQFQEGLNVGLISGKIAGTSGILHEEFDQYVPTEMKDILADWRRRIHEETPLPDSILSLWDSSNTELQENYSQIGEHERVIWYEHANHIDIPKTLLPQLEEPGLSVYNGITEMAATMLGLSDDENRLLMKTYHEFDARFRKLQKEHMHSLSNETYNIQIDAFPNEAAKLKTEWRSFLTNTYGKTHAESIDKMLRIVPNRFKILLIMRRSLGSMNSLPSRIWLNSGENPIKFFIMDESPNRFTIEWEKSSGEQGNTTTFKQFLSDAQKNILLNLFNLEFKED